MGKPLVCALALSGGVWGGFWTCFVVNVNERCPGFDTFNRVRDREIGDINGS